MRFFFYGTLIAGSGNAVATAAHRRLHDLGPATARGALYAVGEAAGWYPILLPGSAHVHGRLYAVTAYFGAADLAALDAWEDFDPADPAGSLYRRVTLPVTDAGGATGEAQAYRFNGAAPPEALAIPGGDFHAWVQHTGRRPFGAPS
jgi:gamma-glutamylcyclotransferase (GGCT)/AIG2-like uncharacterized protein YtfP